MYQMSPFNALNELHRELSRVFDREPSMQLANTNWSPHVDIKESETGFTVIADLPGVKPEDVEVSLHNSVLTIRGERKIDDVEDNGNFRRRERFRGTFLRQFTLPDQTDESAVSAKANHGVLEVTIPKAKKARPISISVTEH